MRTISAIAYDIQKDWGVKVNYGARPYLAAMFSLNTATDSYGCDAKDIILRFLCNASTYRGEKAKGFKKELKQLAGIK